MIAVRVSYWVPSRLYLVTITFEFWVKHWVFVVLKWKHAYIHQYWLLVGRSLHFQIKNLTFINYYWIFVIIDIQRNLFGFDELALPYWFFKDKFFNFGFFLDYFFFFWTKSLKVNVCCFDHSNVINISRLSFLLWLFAY